MVGQTGTRRGGALSPPFPAMPSMAFARALSLFSLPCTSSCFKQFTEPHWILVISLLQNPTLYSLSLPLMQRSAKSDQLLKHHVISACLRFLSLSLSFSPSSPPSPFSYWPSLAEHEGGTAKFKVNLTPLTHQMDRPAPCGSVDQKEEI